jgi:tRNA A37 methylthiotransferase MiaB
MKATNATDFSRKPKIGMISLGCAKNLVDAEIMLGSVLQHGMEITSRAEEADVLVVNTCAFIDSAKEESIEAILEAHQQRGFNKRPDQKLIVSGCMSQRFAKELHNELPEVDAFIGLDQVAELGEIVERVLRKRPTLNAQRSTPNAEGWTLDVGRSALDVEFLLWPESLSNRGREFCTDTIGCFRVKS